MVVCRSHDVDHMMFQSYLSDRYQYVKVEGQSSRYVPLNHGVPQGSSLGPYLFNIYMTPLADILRELGIEFHVYADDHQLYLAFQPIDQDSADVAVNKIQRCMVEVKQWMVNNMLKLNDDKIEFIVIGTRQQRSKIDIPQQTSMELTLHQLVLSVTWV